MYDIKLPLKTGKIPNMTAYTKNVSETLLKISGSMPINPKKNNLSKSELVNP